jgi:hypothetical protein
MSIRGKVAALQLELRRLEFMEDPYVSITERTVNGRTFVRARANWPSYPKSINIDVVIKDPWKYKHLRDPKLEEFAKKKILEKLNVLTNEKDSKFN